MEEAIKTLLLVEDEAIIAMAEALALEGEGYRVVQADSGDAAIAAVRRADPPIDLILMDIDLGRGMDGTDAARAILTDHDIPVVFLSSHIEKEIVEKTEAITSYGYVLKNSGMTVLAASIRMAFRLHAAHCQIMAKERALRAGEQLYHDSIDAMIDPIHVVDRDLCIILVNDAFREWLRQLGIAGDIQGKTIFEAFPFLPPSLAREYEFVLGHGEYLITEETNTISGRKVVSETRKIPIFEAGAVTRVMTVIRDMTGRRRIEQQIIRNEKQWRAMFQQVAVGVAQIESRTGRFVLTNRRYCDIVGYTLEQMTGTTFQSITHPDDLGADLANMDLLLAGTIREFTMEKRYFHRDGSIVWVSLAVSPLWKPGEEPDYHIAVVQDITERKRAEAALAESEERFRRIFQYGPLGMVIVGKDFHFLQANESFCAWLGYDEESLKALTFRDVTHPDHRDQDTTGVMRVMRGEIPRYHTVKRYLRRDGTTVRGAVMVSAIRGVAGDFSHFLALVQDVTDLATAERALGESNDRFRTLVDAIDDVVFTLDAEQRHTGVYGRWLVKDGLAPESFLGRTTREIMGPERSAPHEEANRRALAGERVIYEWSGGEPGSIRYYQTRLSPLTNAEGAITGLVGVGREFTDLRRSEEQLERTLKDKDILFRELQHRVKNNLNVIHSLLGLELDAMPEGRPRRVILDAQTRIRSMSTLYDRLSRSAGLDAVDLRQYLGELAVELMESYAVDPSRVRLSTAIASLPLDVARAVPLGLIVNELIANALKYAYPDGAAGELRIALEIENEYVVLRITDDGAGFPAHVDPDKAPTMGLMIVRMLVHQLGGELSFEPGGGTRAVVRFAR